MFFGSVRGGAAVLPNEFWWKPGCFFLSRSS